MDAVCCVCLQLHAAQPCLDICYRLLLSSDAIAAWYSAVFYRLLLTMLSAHSLACCSAGLLLQFLLQFLHHAGGLLTECNCMLNKVGSTNAALLSSMKSTSAILAGADSCCCYSCAASVTSWTYQHSGPFLIFCNLLREVTQLISCMYRGVGTR